MQLSQGGGIPAAAGPPGAGCVHEPRRGQPGTALHKQIGMCLYDFVSVSAQTKAFEAAGELLKVLAAPARLAIVMELADQPRFVHELVERLGMSQPLVSSHLRVLRGSPPGRGRTARPGSGVLPGRPARRAHRR